MKTIGVLGGGQLSKLLLLRALDYGWPLYVLSPSNKDPAAQNNPYWIKGDPHKLKDLKNFFKKVDVVTFESEFFSASPIKKALKGLKKPEIAPSLKALFAIQNRVRQKQLLESYKLSSAKWLKLKNTTQKTLFNLWDKMEGPFVLKSCTGGYDGYGVFIVKKKSQIKGLKLPKVNFIAEPFIPFKRELALLVARNKNNQIVFFPLVQSFQKNSRCLWVKGPVKHKKIRTLKLKIKHFLKGINYQGLMAFELFDTGAELLINELAPRVHNTGHYSLNALSEDQFTIHLKAILNKNLTKNLCLKQNFAMLNLLGEGYKKPSLYKKKKKIYLKEFLNIAVSKNMFFYWYGKADSRKGRKMGHLNQLNPSADKALKELLKARQQFKV